MGMEFIKKSGYSVLVFFIVTVEVTEALWKKLSFSLFAGIPAGVLEGILALRVQIRS